MPDTECHTRPAESRLQSSGGYAAPLILLAQTRQADRDKCQTEADAKHREDIARASDERQVVAASQTAMPVKMVEQNTQLTETVKDLTERVTQRRMGVPAFNIVVLPIRRMNRAGDLGRVLHSRTSCARPD